MQLYLFYFILVPNQHIRTISERLWDTEVWSNDTKKCSFPSQKYNKIEMLFKIVVIFLFVCLFKYLAVLVRLKQIKCLYQPQYFEQYCTLDYKKWINKYINENK